MIFGTRLPLAATAALLLAQALANGLRAEELEPVAVILNVDAEGDDVHATLVWSEETELPPVARLVVREPSGRTVGEQTVFPAPGSVVVESVSDALRKASKHGLRYQILVAANDDDTLSKTTHFQVLLECTPTGDCRYVVVPGVKTDAVYVSAELDQVLTELETSSDVLSEVIERFPHLTGEVYALAVQLSMLDQQTGFSRPKNCACFWAGYSRKAPIEIFAEDVPDLPPGVMPDYQVRIVAGFTFDLFYMSAQARSGFAAATRSFEATVGMRLRCFEVRAWRPMAVTISGASRNAVLRFRQPSMKACLAKCDGAVTHELDLELSLEATGRNAGPFAPLAAPVPPDPDVVSLAEEDVVYMVDAAGLLITRQSVLAIPAPGSSQTDTASFSRSLTTKALAPSEAKLLLHGRVAAGVVPSVDGYASAEMVNNATSSDTPGNGHVMSARAQAACAIDVDVALELQNLCSIRDSLGGVRIERWE